MKRIYYLPLVFTYLFFVFNSYGFAQKIPINKGTSGIQLLPYSQIYIDKTRSVTITSILKNRKNVFEKNKKDILGFGYSPNFDVWIKVTLHNNSLEKIEKIIEYNNALTTNIEFYDPDLNYKVQYGGILNRQLSTKTLNSIFTISLKPNETKTYYIKTSSKITTLIVQLKLWDRESFYNKEIMQQVILALFFGAMFILGIYNLFIYFFTKDISYLFYVAYIMGLIIHQLVYVGIVSTYLFSPEQMKTTIELAAILVAMPVYALGLFTKSFLNTKQYKRHNTILNCFLVIIPLGILFFLLTDNYDKFRNLFPMLLLMYLFYLTAYAFIKKNKQASFILFGWFIFVLTGMSMYLSSAGVFSIHEYFPYLIEVSFLLEAVIFSIALANRINSLQQEKNEANKKLIMQKKQETQKLEKTVKEKTKSLTNALSEKDVLLKELNHRVKNNMQTIISLIRLQSYEIEDMKLQGYLKTIQNRISAMSHLHELLYKQDNLHKIKTAFYFRIIVDELQESYEKDTLMKLDISIDLDTEEAIYCGLIVNELVTNSIKYAFKDDNEDGHIIIRLYTEGDMNYLEVKDNGKGYDKTKSSNSLGLTLVETLAVQQLGGKYKIDTLNGTRTIIQWDKNG